MQKAVRPYVASGNWPDEIRPWISKAVGNLSALRHSAKNS
jgi:hypothetical protein